ncbi:hypothetical protein [Halopiger thermotolerans]
MPLADSSRQAAIAVLDHGAIGHDDLPRGLVTRDVATLKTTEPADRDRRMERSFRHVRLPILGDEIHPLRP